MSLALAAQHLQNHGRGNDSMLVHMSPREVKSLNDLAMAHGGSLTINPKTGLPEAGFLEDMLPMIASAGLAYMTGGTSLAGEGILGAAGLGLSNAAIIGGGMGLLKYAQTGDIGQGLMAGLGAYGGAGLGSSIADMGATQAGLENLGADKFVDNGTGLNVLQSEISKTPTLTGLQEPLGARGIGVPETNVLSAQPAPGVAYPDYQAGLATPPTPASISNVADAGPSYGGELGFNEGQLESLSNNPFQKSNFDSMPIGDRVSASWNAIKANPTDFLKNNWKPIAMAAAPTVLGMLNKKDAGAPAKPADTDMGQRYAYTRQPTNIAAPGQPSQLPAPDLGTYAGGSGREQNYYQPGPIYTPITNAEAYKLYGYGTKTAAKGGLMHYDNGGMTGYSAYGGIPGQQAANRAQPAPQHIDVVSDYNNYVKGIAAAPQAATAGTGIGHAVDPNSFGYSYNPTTQQYTSMAPPEPAADSGAGAGEPPSGPSSDYSTDQATGVKRGGLLAAGGLSHLGDYSDGGRLLRGPGDGISDSIPAVIGKKQPARLADGEFVIPARIVSELGNGSTEAGARRLYAMMDRVQKARGKTVGKGKVAKNSRADKYLPA